MEQGTLEWRLARCGFVGASSVTDVLAKGQGVTRKNYMMRLLTERLTGIPVETYKSDAMDWGTETEPMARMAYEFETGNSVEQVGFILHKTIEWFGASPDGLMSDRGLEIKCPNTTTHIDTLLTGKIKKEYIYQMQTGMAVTGLDKWDFVSYDPRLPPNLQLFIKTVDRDESIIQEIETGVIEFLKDLDELVKTLLSRGKA